MESELRSRLGVRRLRKVIGLVSIFLSISCEHSMTRRLVADHFHRHFDIRSDTEEETGKRREAWGRREEEELPTASRQLVL